MGDENISQFSRRSVLRLGVMAAGAAALIVAGAGRADAAAPPDGRAFLGDGRSGVDGGLNRAAITPNAAAVLRSYNGWTIGTPGATIGVKSYPIPGSTVKLDIRSGDVATVFVYVAQRFHAEVEKLIAGQSGGYEYRKNVNNPNTWSNHASGTAMDFNWEKHPNGQRGTFTRAQLSALRNILACCGNVIRWGGDYLGTVDEMHFEINVPPGAPALATLAKQIAARTVRPPIASFYATSRSAWITAESRGAKPLVANRAAIGPWEQFDLIGQGGPNVALRAHANGRFVCADDNGRAPLIANRTVVGPWETFTMSTGGNGLTRLLSHANNRYVTVTADGTLVASATSISTPQELRISVG